MLGRVLCIAIVLACSASALAQDRETISHERFSRGVQLYTSHQFAQALEEFRGSNELQSSPNSRLFIARCLRALNRLDEAVGQYRLTVAEATDRAQVDPRYGPTRTAAADELHTLEPRIGSLTVRARNLPSGATVRIDTHVVPHEGLNVVLPVMPGEHEVTADADGYIAFRGTLRIDAGRTGSIEVDLAPLNGATASSTQSEHVTATEHSSSSPPLTLSIAGWVGIGIGAAGFLSFGIFAFEANTQFDVLNQRCHMMACPSSEQSALSLGYTYQVITNVSLGLGIGFGAVGILLEVLAVVRHPSHDSVASRQPHIAFDGHSLFIGANF